LHRAADRWGHRDLIFVRDQRLRASMEREALILKKMIPVLVVEDEALIAEVVARALEREGLAVEIVADSDAALRAITDRRYDLIVLDLMLPGRDGLEVCREIRRTDRRTPIIMLTARDALEDKVLGLDSGADDYVTKPFELEELSARVRSLLRRTHPISSTRREVAGLVIDGDSREARLQGRLIPLTDTEFRLLEHLMRRAGEVCRRQELLEQVWGYHFDPGSNVVDVFIRRLRHKLDAARRDPGPVRTVQQSAPEPGLPHIETVRGIGYRLSS
jgi:DNA-binding response OmpR family regulator